ncbi:hypothetical protein AURDEDRAFT_130895 [Auricularia subglabra TFB-10046 SS5]|nr:hypothetical protein AURDEDRAFT_130895 [Auricularia subglabra TFB-10046 SS5]
MAHGMDVALSMTKTFQVVLQDDLHPAQRYCPICLLIYPCLLGGNSPVIPILQTEHHSFLDMCVRKLSLALTAREKQTLRQRLHHNIDTCAYRHLPSTRPHDEQLREYDCEHVEDPVDIMRATLCKSLRCCLYGFDTAARNPECVMDRAARPHKRFRSTTGIWPTSVDQLFPYGPDRTVEGIIDCCCAFLSPSPLLVLNAILDLTRPRVWDLLLEPTTHHRLAWAICVTILLGIPDAHAKLSLYTGRAPPGCSVPQKWKKARWLQDGTGITSASTLADTIRFGSYALPDDELRFAAPHAEILENVFPLAVDYYRTTQPVVCETLNSYLDTLRRTRIAEQHVSEDLDSVLEHDPRSLGVLRIVRLAIGWLQHARRCAAPQCSRTLVDRPDDEDKPLSACARCRLAQYCSRECQRRDWKAGEPVPHKQLCPILSELQSRADRNLPETDYVDAVRQSTIANDELVIAGRQRHPMETIADLDLVNQWIPHPPHSHKRPEAQRSKSLVDERILLDEAEIFHTSLQRAESANGRSASSIVRVHCAPSEPTASWIVRRTAREREQRLRFNMDHCHHQKDVGGHNDTLRRLELSHIDEPYHLRDVLLCHSLRLCLHAVDPTSATPQRSADERARFARKRFRASSGAWPTSIEQLFPYGEARTVEGLVDCCCTLTSEHPFWVLSAILNLARPRVWDLLLRPDIHFRLCWAISTTLLLSVPGVGGAYALEAGRGSGCSIPARWKDAQWLGDGSTALEAVTTLLSTINTGAYARPDDRLTFVGPHAKILGHAFSLALRHYRSAQPAACQTISSYVAAAKFAADSGVRAPDESASELFERDSRSSAVIGLTRMAISWLNCDRRCAAHHCASTMLDRADGEDKPLSLCARCKLTRYCSKDCQRGDWTDGQPFPHKVLCPIFAKLQETADHRLAESEYVPLVRNSSIQDTELALAGRWALSLGKCMDHGLQILRERSNASMSHS